MLDRTDAGAFARSLVDGLDEALVALDAARDVVEWNAALTRLTGLDRAAAVGQPGARALPLLADPRLAARIERALLGAVPDPIELAHTGGDVSQPVWLLARCLPWRDDAGRPVGVIVFFHDVTDRHRRAAFRRALEAIGHSLASSLDLNEVLDTIVHRAREVMAAEAALVVAWDGQAPEMSVLRSVGRLSPDYSMGPIPFGSGPTSRAVLEARPVATRNILSDPGVRLAEDRRTEVEREGYKATAAAPLVSEGRVHGALVVHYWEERGFTEEELAALRLLAEQAALAIQNARLYSDATRRAERLRELTALQPLVAGSLDLDDVLRRIAQATARLLDARVVLVWRADARRRLLRRRAASVEPGMDESRLPDTIAFGHGIAGRAAETRTTIYVPDVRQDERAVTVGWAKERQLTSLLAVPILTGDDLLGVFTVHGPPGATPSDEDRMLATSLAAQAAVAIGNARLYRVARRRQETAEVLASLGRELGGSLDPTRVAEVLARGLVELFGARIAGVFRYAPDDGSLHALAAAGTEAPALHGLVLDAGEGASGRAVAERRIVATPDILNDPAVVVSAEMRARIEAHGNRATVAAPLLTHERIIGALYVGAEAGHVFSDDELHTLSAIADQAALAFENARLYAQAEESVARLRSAQTQLVQAAKMSALGQLVSGVAHELNNPLSVIIGYGQLLLGREVPQAMQRPIELMVSQGDRMAKIVKNLLLFSRQRPPERVAVNLHEVIERTLSLRQNQLAVSSIGVEKDFAPDLPPVAGDSYQLEQVFINLLLNAEQAILDGGRDGRILLRTRLEEDGRLLRAQVIDDGPGIPADVLPRVFEPFFTTKEVGAGTGLGLSVSYGIAAEHGGRLSVESRPGETVFTVELPVIDVAAFPVETPEPVAEPVSGGGRPALVVEDEPAVLDLVVTLLKQTGWEVDVATGGRAGLERIRARCYDLIVSDIRMPEGGGEEFYRSAIAHEPSLRQRFVFITGDTATRTAWQFLTDADGPVIEKPFQPALFLDAVRRVTTALTGSTPPE